MLQNKDEFKEIDGVKYLVKHCPKCKNELLYKLRDEERRVYGACAKCGATIEAWVPKK